MIKTLLFFVAAAFGVCTADGNRYLRPMCKSAEEGERCRRKGKVCGSCKCDGEVWVCDEAFFDFVLTTIQSRCNDRQDRRCRKDNIVCGDCVCTNRKWSCPLDPQDQSSDVDPQDQSSDVNPQDQPPDIDPQDQPSDADPQDQLSTTEPPTDPSIIATLPATTTTTTTPTGPVMCTTDVPNFTPGGLCFGRGFASCQLETGSCDSYDLTTGTCIPHVWVSNCHCNGRGGVFWECEPMPACVSVSACSCKLETVVAGEWCHNEGQVCPESGPGQPVAGPGLPGPQPIPNPVALQPGGASSTCKCEMNKWVCGA